MSFNLNTNSLNVNAIDFGLISKDFNVGSIDTSSLFNCVGAAITCDNDNTVNNNVAINNGTNGGGGGGDEPGTLTVYKVMLCESTGGSPGNIEVCDYAIESANFPDPEDYTITVSGNNPTPSSFPGSEAGTPVSIGAGEYTVDETLASTAALQAELDATSIVTDTSATGDCTPNLNANQIFEDATGTMTSGGSQECTLINNIIIFGGTVPTG